MAVYRTWTVECDNCGETFEISDNTIADSEDQARDLAQNRGEMIVTPIGEFCSGACYNEERRDQMMDAAYAMWKEDSR